MQCHINIRARARTRAQKASEFLQREPLSSSLILHPFHAKRFKSTETSFSGWGGGEGGEKRQGELRTADKKKKKQAFPLAPTDSEPSDRTTLPLLFILPSLSLSSTQPPPPPPPLRHRPASVFSGRWREEKKGKPRRYRSPLPSPGASDASPERRNAGPCHPE